MQTTLNYYGKNMQVQLSPSAAQQSKTMQQRLLIEVQVYFSCLLAKRLAFYSEQAINGAYQIETELFDQLWQKSHKITEHLAIRYNTIMTQSCAVSEETTTPPVTDFEIENQKPYVPAWLQLDFNNNLWSGEFGWSSSVKGYANTKQVRRKLAAG